MKLVQNVTRMSTFLVFPVSSAKIWKGGLTILSESVLQVGEDFFFFNSCSRLGHVNSNVYSGVSSLDMDTLDSLVALMKGGSWGYQARVLRAADSETDPLWSSGAIPCSDRCLHSSQQPKTLARLDFFTG